MSIKIELEISDKQYKDLIIDCILENALDDILWSFNFNTDIPDGLVEGTLTELKYDKDNLSKNEEIKSILSKHLQSYFKDKLENALYELEFPELKKLIKGSEKQIKASVREKMKPIEQKYREDIKKQLSWLSINIRDTEEGYKDAIALLKKNGFTV